MKNIQKIFNYLQNFDTTTTKSFHTFLDSPYFNKKAEMKILSKRFTNCSSINSKKLSKKAIYKKLYPSKSYSEQRLDRLFAKFIDLIEKFIVHNNLEIDESEKNFQLLNYCSKQTLYEQFNLLQENLKETYAGKSIKNDKDYIKIYSVTVKNYLYLTISNFQKNNDALQLVELENALKSLDKYYFINKLRLTTHIFNLQKITKKDIPIILLDEILEQANTSFFKNVSLINAYHEAIKFLKDQSNQTSVDNLLSILKSNKLSNSKIDEKILYEIVNNYYALKINAGESKYYHPLFELYKSQIKNKNFYNDGYLFNETVFNITTIALRLNELEWLESFLNEYEPKFQPDHREEIISFNMAQLKFYRRDYTASLTHLNSNSYKTVNYKFFSKTLKIKIFYEQNEDKKLDSQINAQYRLVNRNVNYIADQYSELYKSFISILKKLISIPKFEKEKLKRLLARIQDTQYLAERIWLEEKVKEKLGISHKKNPRTK